jgi:hypothetical protein
MSVKSSWLAAVSAALLATSGAAQITGSRVNPGTLPGDRAKARAPADAPERPAEARVEAEAEADAAVETQADDGSPTGGAIVAATRSDVRAGAEVRDTQGGLVGTVESVDSDGAVVSTGNVRAKLPFGSFGRNDRGLVISLSRAELEAAASSQSPC